MIEILIATWAAIVAALSGVWGLVEVAATWVGSVLYHLHVDAPRLEGLLIGVILTWLLLRRERHPLLKVLSAPLKLIVDILDLVWDQLVEVCVDSKETLKGWVLNLVSPVKKAVIQSWSLLLSQLTKIKEKLSKKKNEEEAE